MPSTKRLDDWACKAHLGSQAQSAVEYAILIGILAAALVGMQTYVKRGLQARLRTVVDGATTAIGAPTQYEPYYASSTSNVTQDGQVTVAYAPGGQITKAERSDTITDPKAWQLVGVDLAADEEWQ